MPTNTFYVVFHGLISLIESQTRYRAILIDMPDHRVALGHWLTERTIPRGVSLTLAGVDTNGTGKMDPQNNVIVRLADVPAASVAKFRYADMYLPKPNRILSFSTGNAQAQLSGTTPLSSTKYSAVQVFEYNVSGSLLSIAVTGSGFEWDIAGETTLTSGDRMAVLHIMNEPDAPITDGHAVEEFGRGCLMLGVDVKISGALQFPGLPSPLNLPLGLLKEELLPLAHREAAVLPLTDFFRIHTPPAGAIPIGGSRFCGSIHATLV